MENLQSKDYILPISPSGTLSSISGNTGKIIHLDNTLDNTFFTTDTLQGKNLLTNVLD